MVTDDCTQVYTCTFADDGKPAPFIENLLPCSDNAICILNDDNQPECKCLEGYDGDGYSCSKYFIF